MIKSRTPPWDRPLLATDESEADFHLFLSYRNGDYDKLSEWARNTASSLCTLSESTLRTLGSKHRWKARRRAYRAVVAIQEAEEHADIINRLGQRRRELLEIIGTIVTDALQDQDPGSLSPGEITSMLKLWLDATRLEAGEATQIVESPLIIQTMNEIDLDSALEAVYGVEDD